MLWAVEGLVGQGGKLLHGEVLSHCSPLEHLVDYGAVQHLLRTAVETLQTEGTENVDMELGEGVKQDFVQDLVKNGKVLF